MEQVVAGKITVRQGVNGAQRTTGETVEERDERERGGALAHGTRGHRLLDHKRRVLSLPPRAKVDVLVHLDGSTDAFYQGQRYILEAFEVPNPQRRETQPAQRKPVARKPSPDNPWVKFKIPKARRDPVESYFRKHEAAHMSSLLD
jgi:hypothetical protein